MTSLLTVEQCQRAIGALEGVWGVLPRSDRAERKGEHALVRDVLMLAMDMARSYQRRETRPGSPGALRDGEPTGEPSGGNDEPSDVDDDEPPVPYAWSAVRYLDPEEWEEIKILKQIQFLTDDGRAELFMELSETFHTDCGGELPEDPNAPPHVCGAPADEDEDADADEDAAPDPEESKS